MKLKQLQLDLKPKVNLDPHLANCSCSAHSLDPEFWEPNTAANRKRWNGNRMAYLKERYGTFPK